MNPIRTSILSTLVLLLAAGLLAVPGTADAASTAHARSGAAAGASARTVAGADRAVLTWRGRESVARLPVGPAVLPGAPHSFRVFAREQLRETWTGYLHHRPACRRAPQMTVRHLSTAGFAYGSAGTSPQPGCQTGGGYQAFWAVRRGEWKQVIGTQDVASCARLTKLGFPSSVATVQCYDGQEVIDYSHP